MGGLWHHAHIGGTAAAGMQRAHRSFGVRPARMTLSEVAMHSTSSPDTYACGTFAAR